MDISAALASVNAALATVKTLRGIEKAYDHAELKLQMVDLMGHIAEAKAALLEAKDQLAAKDLEIIELQSKLQSRTELVEHKGYSYKKGSDGAPQGSPFCNACLVKDGTQIRYSNLLGDHWQCPRCQALASDLWVFPFE